MTDAQTTTQMTLSFGGNGLGTAIPIASLSGSLYTVPAASLSTNYGPLATGDNSNNATYNTPDPIIAAFDLGPVAFTVNSLTNTLFGITGGNVAGGQSTMGSGTAHVAFIVAAGIARDDRWRLDRTCLHASPSQGCLALKFLHTLQLRRMIESSVQSSVLFWCRTLLKIG